MAGRGKGNWAGRGREGRRRRAGLPGLAWAGGMGLARGKKGIGELGRAGEGEGKLDPRGRVGPDWFGVLGWILGLGFFLFLSSISNQIQTN